MKNLSSFNNSLQTSGNRGVQLLDFWERYVVFMRFELLNSPVFLVGEHCVAELGEDFLKKDNV